MQPTCYRSVIPMLISRASQGGTLTWMLGIRLRLEQAAVEQNRQDAYFSSDNTGTYCQNGSLAPEKRTPKWI